MSGFEQELKFARVKTVQDFAEKVALFDPENVLISQHFKLDTLVSVKKNVVHFHVRLRMGKLRGFTFILLSLSLRMLYRLEFS